MWRRIRVCHSICVVVVTIEGQMQYTAHFPAGTAQYGLQPCGHSPQKGGNSLWSLTYLRAETEVNIVSRKKKNFAKYFSVWSGTSSGYVKDNELNLLWFGVFLLCNSYVYIFYKFKKKIFLRQFPLKLFQTSLVAVTEKHCVYFG